MEAGLIKVQTLVIPIIYRSRAMIVIFVSIGMRWVR